jgi:hypothetical protein
VPHPAYSPDLTPSDLFFFFFFGTLKTGLHNYEIHSRDELISAIWSIFDEIPKETFNYIYDSWKTRLR